MQRQKDLSQEIIDIKRQIAQSVVVNNIVGFNFKEPITFNSGIKSPIYFDFKKSIAYPLLRDLITFGFRQFIFEQHTSGIDIIAGIAKGGVPHAAFLAKELNRPMSYVSIQSKDHGTKKMIDGADVAGKKVVVIEDVVSMGGSIMKGIEIIQQGRPLVVYPYSIFSYDFAQSRKEFEEANLSLTPLITITDLLPILEIKLKKNEYDSLREWIDKFC